jgi:hypothetical protein
MSWRFARSDNDMAMMWYTNSLVYKITKEWVMYIRITTQSKVHLLVILTYQTRSIEDPS